MRRTLLIVLVFAGGIAIGWFGRSSRAADGATRPAASSNRNGWIVKPSPDGEGKLVPVRLLRIAYADGRVVEYGPPMKRGDNDRLLVPANCWVVGVDGHTYYCVQDE